MTLKEKSLYSNRLILDYPFHWTELTKDYVDANIQCPLESSVLTQSIVRKTLLQHYYYFNDLMRVMAQSLACPVTIHSIAFVEGTPTDLADYEAHTFKHLSLLSDSGRVSIMLSDSFLSSFVHYALGCTDQSILSLSMTHREKKLVELFGGMFLKSFQYAWGQSHGQAAFHWDSDPYSNGVNNGKSCFYMMTLSIDGGSPVVIGSYYDAKTVLRLSKENVAEVGTKDPIALTVDSMAKIPVRMTGVLGQTRMSMADLAQLQVGDVVALPTRLDEAVSIEIGDTQFGAILGKKNRALAVKLLANELNLDPLDNLELLDKSDRSTEQVPPDSKQDESIAGSMPDQEIASPTIEDNTSAHADQTDDKPNRVEATNDSPSDSFSWDDINDSMISAIDDTDVDNDLESSFWLEDDNADGQSE